MDLNQRSILTGQVRSGYIYLSNNIKLKPMSIDLYNESMLVYNESYTKALSEEILTLEDSFLYLKNTGYFTNLDEAEMVRLDKNIESSQNDLYNSRKNKKELKKNKENIDRLRKLYSEINNRKFSLYENTCEHYAETKRLFWLLPRLACYRKGHPKCSPKYLQSLYHNSILSEECVRDLVLHDPWRSAWILKKYKDVLYNKDYELNLNQKNIILWSITYDNIRESLDSPEDEFYSDNYVIDAWFVWSKKKREAEKRKQDAEAKISKNSKINSADHVFLVVDPEEESSVEDVYAMNDASDRIRAKQFFDAVKKNQNTSRPK